MPSSGGTLRMVDLFAGCGGFTLGVIEACRKAALNVQVAYALDADEDALQVYRKNLSPLRADCLRIESVFQGRARAPLNDREKKLASAVGSVDILVAGPPCQGHSDLNNFSRRADRRNALYARVARAAQVFQPRVVVIENVPGVVRDKGHVTGRAASRLRGQGYEIKTITLDALALGVPQRRRRHFLIAFRRDLNDFWREPPKRILAKRALASVLTGLEDEPLHSSSVFTTPSTPTATNRKRIKYLFDHELYDLPDRQRPECHRDGDHTYQTVYGRLRWDGIANTITSGFGSMGQGRFVHPTRSRMITPHEAARIQGFPDWFLFQDIASRGSLQTMIGNAVVPKVAASLTRHLLACGVLSPSMGTSASTRPRPARITG
jgi:DNA (cytosine-5)-methyltransferase 1